MTEPVRPGAAEPTIDDMVGALNDDFHRRTGFIPPTDPNEEVDYPEPSEDDLEWMEAAGMLSCPYYQGVPPNRCGGGCWEEPACMTNEPMEGWKSVLESAFHDLRAQD